ncbi:MAG: protein kinase domain-containing protein [Pirellulaceae bacterium]
MPASSDRNLLFGILALQMDFITREQLVAGMQAWVLAKDIALAEHLVQAGAMKPANRQLLEPLVEAHIRQHGDDPQQSLASISSVDALRNELAGLGDQQIDASMANIPIGNKPAKEADPYATISVGAASSQGMRFRILRPHAEGGLGRVSVALDGELGREVALKEIKPERADDPDSRGRFTREAEITGGLEHPGIVPVYGLGAYPDGRPFYAMRFIRGKSLKEAIEKFHENFTASGGRKPPDTSAPRTAHSSTEENLELRKLLQRLIDVCEAMDYAHSRGVLHRDLKPGNIMLGKYGETLVVDWGLAKPLGKSPAPTPEQQQTNTTVGLSSLPEAALQPSSSGGSEPTMLGSALGTPAFMSPEQAQGRLDLLSPASDVFSLGAILYQILTGQPPYTAASKDEVLRKAQMGEFPTPRTLRGGIPAPLEAVCLKALAPTSASRYPTCRAFAQDLERFLADEPVSARHELLSEWFARLSRRHRTVFIASTGALMLLTLGSLIALGVVNHFRDAANTTAEKNKYLADTLQGKNTEIQKTSEKNKSLADELKTKNEALEKGKKELNTRLAASYFQHGLSEYEAGRVGSSCLDLRRALHFLPEGNHLEESYKTILTDRVLQGGKVAAASLRHDGRVWQVAFSPDGTRLATSGWDKTARIWDARTGAAVGEPLRHEGAVWHVAFSPDGTRLATASDDKTARIWDARTGAAVGEPLRHAGAVLDVAFSPDGAKLATASLDTTARIWDAGTGAAASEPLRHDGAVRHVVFSPDGARLATASDDDTARIWDAGTGAPASEPLRHEDQVRHVAFSPDGARLATASDDYTARIWDAGTGAPASEPLRHEGVVMHVAFSLDGTRLATASVDKTARIWDVRTGTAVGEPLRHKGEVLHVAFSPDGTRLATASLDQTARIWDAGTGTALGEPLRHNYVVWRVAFSPDGTRLATGSDDETARIWDAGTGAATSEPLRHDGYVRHVAFSPDGTRLVTASFDKTARIWDAGTGAAVGEPLRHENRVVHVVFSPDGTRLATASLDNTARIWDGRTGTALGEPLRHDGAVRYVAFSPDGARLATASEDKTTRIWDVPRFPIFTLIERNVWLNAMTGERLNDKGDIEDLTFDEWQSECKKLDQLKPWQDYLTEGRRRQQSLHFAQSHEAKFNKQWFAAAFHLRWALKQEPGNEELKKRLAVAEGKLKEEHEAAQKAGPKVEGPAKREE